MPVPNTAQYTSTKISRLALSVSAEWWDAASAVRMTP